MDIYLIVIAAVAVSISILEYIKLSKQNKMMEQLTEEMDQFLYSSKMKHLENLDEGVFANLYNQISRLESQYLEGISAGGKVEAEMVKFIENMAHQIKNSLTSLQMQVDLLSMTVDEKQAVHLEKCQNSVNRLTWEIDRLLKSSQLAGGKIKMNCDQMNLIEEIRKVMTTLSSLATDKNIGIKLASEETLTYSGDAFWISQAIENILKNAIEHSHRDGNINISARESCGIISIRIEDEGDGIPASELENLFKRYHRGQTNKAGYGIGLSMAKDIIKYHHGDIKVGHGEKGACFEIELVNLDTSDIYR